MSEKMLSDDAMPQVDTQLCFGLYSTALAINKLYRKRLGPLGITYPQYLVLMVLWQQDQLTVNGIGDCLYLDSATLTPLLKRMEALDLVTRIRSSSDERQVIISLTPSGNALRTEAAALSNAVLTAADCSVAEAKALNGQLTRLRLKLLQGI